MVIINPHNGKPIFSSKTAEQETYDKQHFKVIKEHALRILNSGIKSDKELRVAILNLYRSEIDKHMQELTIHPERTALYFLACLEIHHICLQHIWRTMQVQELLKKDKGEKKGDKQ